MKQHRKITLFTLSSLLLFSGCAGTARENSAPSATPAVSEAPAQNVSTVSVSVRLHREDNTPLANETIQISVGENSMDCLLDENGAFQVPSIPVNGAFTINLMEEEQEGTFIMVRFSTGSVIDAITGSDGVGSVTLKEDTKEVALDFTLKEDGTLSCALQLSQTQDLTI